MIKKVNHIAILVSDLDKALLTYQAGLGLELAKRQDMPEQEVEIAFLPTGDSMIELIKPTTETSGVAKFLAKRGEGLHHICLEVDNIEEAIKEKIGGLTAGMKIQEMQARGVEMIHSTPIQAAEGRGAFLHPRGAHGVLIELLEAD